MAAKRRRWPGARQAATTVVLAAGVLVLVALLSGAVDTWPDLGRRVGSGGVAASAPVVAPTTTFATTTTLPPTTTTVAPAAGADGTLEPGERGEEVSAIQGRLIELGFWLGAPDGHYGQLTRQAVLAFQKAHGLPRDGVAGPATLAALPAAARPVAREAVGTHLEIDLERQILLIIHDGQTQWAINTSTGNGETYAAPGGGSGVARTPRGTFVIYREVDGYRRAPLGTLYRPKYFHGGIAIHGAGSIPAYPASHGCARVTNSAADLLWSSGVAPIGTQVLVY